MSIGLPILITLVISYSLQAKILANQADFTRWLSSFGPYVILIYIVLQSITIIIAPIGGFFLVVAMMALFGPAIALTFTYLVTTSCYLINFYLARRYGRGLVKKLIGQEPLEKLDHIVKDAGLPLLIITRILQGANFDYISYVWGLTEIPFRTFAIVNIIGGIPATLVTYLLISSFDNLILGVLAFYASSIIFAGLAFYLTHRLKKHKQI